MLKRKEFFGTSSSSDSSSDQVNRIISGTEITGDIVSNSGILIEGEVIGNISCSAQVKIGSSGKIKGNLVCLNAEIEGALDGELTIENLLILRSTARIKGDIEALKLNIEEGAFFEGACVMKAPMAKNNFNSDIELDSEEDEAQ
jgi:cytoskeletal protein CcmA (bactofilin family)